MTDSNTESHEERLERFCHADLEHPLIAQLFEFELPVPNTTPDE